MKKKILIISGGISKERLISLDTGLQVAKELKKNGYKVKISEPDNQLTKNINQFKPNIIFNALHGQFGEDGYTYRQFLKDLKFHIRILVQWPQLWLWIKKHQRKFLLKIKFPHQNLSNIHMKRNNLDLIKIIEKKLKFPVVLKPINEGSSVNVFICTKKNISKFLKLLESTNK